MTRKKRTPEEMERRAKIRELLQVSNVSSMADIQNLFKETIAEFMENSLDAELDDELGYSKYDYRNRRRTRVIGTFPDGNSALMLVCARLRHVAGTQWGNKKYMNMKHLESALEDAFIAG